MKLVRTSLVKVLIVIFSFQVLLLMLCFLSFSLALPNPKSAEGTAFGARTSVNKPKPAHGSIGSHGFKGFGDVNC